MQHREQDRLVFRELFDTYFRNPEIAQKLLSQLLPSAEGKAEPSKRRPRVREALAPRRDPGAAATRPADREVQFDAAMTASDTARLKHADFNQLSGVEYALVQRLARLLNIEVRLKSELGVGTEGCLSLLRVSDDAEAHGTAVVQPPPPITHVSLGLTVLVIDDDVAVCRACAMLLESAGMHSLAAISIIIFFGILVRF